MTFMRSPRIDIALVERKPIERQSASLGAPSEPVDWTGIKGGTSQLSAGREIFMKASSILAGATAILMIAGPACSKDASGPTDAEIAHIAFTAGSLDIEAGKQALAKARSPAVREFAQTMVRDHQAVNEQALALLEKLGVAPRPNATSQSLAAEAQAQSDRLKAFNGADFDRAYVRNEVAFHQNVNRALETVLIPEADNAELKSLLQTGLALFQAHQDHAEQLARQVK